MDSTGPPGTATSRRDFLRMGASWAAGLALLGSAGMVEVLAQASPGSSPGSRLVEEFEEAAGEYDLPVALLLAIGFVNTRLEMPPVEASAHEPGDPQGRGAYGIMQLVQNDTEDTLGEASELTGLSQEDLKADRRSNIRGGAALLAESQGEKPFSLGEYFGAVSGKGGYGRPVQAVAGVGAGDYFAEQVFEILRKGPSATTSEGEQVEVPSKEGEV